MLATGSFMPMSVLPSGSAPGKKPLYILFHGEKILTARNGNGEFQHRLVVGESELPGRAEEIADSDGLHFLGLWNERPCLCAKLREDFAAPDAFSFMGRRELYGLVPDEEFKTAGFAFQISDWLRLNRFCGGCGGRNQPHKTQRALVCQACGHTIWPRINPAIIVLIHRGSEAALLIRAPHFAPGIYSTVAGFVEPGESMEETVHREIMEETGVRVKNLRYYRSQPWPFPSSLMIGFFAEYESGTPRADGEEIIEARWFARDGLPMLPGPLSLGRQMLDRFIAGTMPE